MNRFNKKSGIVINLLKNYSQRQNINSLDQEKLMEKCIVFILILEDYKCLKKFLRAL